MDKRETHLMTVILECLEKAGLSKWTPFVRRHICPKGRGTLAHTSCRSMPNDGLIKAEDEMFVQ